MKKVLRTFLILAVVALLASPLSAADDEKKKKDKKPGAKRQQSPAAALFRVPKQVQLTDQQKEQVKELVAKFNPRVAELNAKEGKIITPEQRKARATALKKAREDGKKGKELREVVDAALQVSAEQKEALTELGKARRAVQQEARTALLSILTDEQKAQLPKRGEGRKPKAEGTAKKPAVKKEAPKKDAPKKEAPKKDAAK